MIVEVGQAAHPLTRTHVLTPPPAAPSSRPQLHYSCRDRDLGCPFCKSRYVGQVQVGPDDRLSSGPSGPPLQTWRPPAVLEESKDLVQASSAAWRCPARCLKAIPVFRSRWPPGNEQSLPQTALFVRLVALIVERRQQASNTGK
jgi:hypothetical protein